MKARHTIFAALLLSCLSSISAQAAHVDILAYNDNGSLDTGYVDVDSGTTVTGVRLFTETLNIIYSGIYGSTAPGYFSNDEYPLLASSDLGFDALAITHPISQIDYNLLYWDGEGDVDFGVPVSGDTLQFRLSSATNISVDGSSSDVAGFVLDGTSPSGVLHKHISYSARGAGGAYAADGFYLVCIQLKMSGLTDSEPVYLLFNADYERNTQNQIIYEGDQPVVNEEGQTLAEVWIEQYLIGGGLAGDLNSDGFVGLDDLDIVLGNWNQNVPPADSHADPSGDGFVGLDDLDIVLNNWNAGTPPTGSSVVPEPGTFALLAGMGLFACRRR